MLRDDADARLPSLSALKFENTSILLLISPFG